MPNAFISGTGSSIPERVVTNQDLVDTYGIDSDDAWIQKRTGIKTRRFTEPGTGTTELGADAGAKAIAAAGLAPQDIDMILAATISPEYAFPGIGVTIGEKLGLCEGAGATFTPAMDIRNQCSGFVYGLSTAAAMVQSGAHKHVLVIGSEIHSAALDLSTRGRTVASLFGDGAGAVVVSATDEDRGVRSWKLGSDGRHAEVLCQKIWDMRQRPFIPVDEDGHGRVDPKAMYAHMDGRQVFRHAVERMCTVTMQICLENGVTGDEVDLFLFHQANMRINQFVAKQLAIPEEKLIHNIDKYGNTTAATIPLLIDEAVRTGRLTPGMKVACVAFGSGFTWGAALIDW